MRHLLPLLTLLFTLGCTTQEPPEPSEEELQEQCIIDQLEIQSDYYIWVGEIKKACTWFPARNDYHVCTSGPKHAYIDDNDPCKATKYQTQNLIDWFNAHAPEFVAACKADDECYQWAVNYTSGSIFPRWWEVDTKVQNSDPKKDRHISLELVDLEQAHITPDPPTTTPEPKPESEPNSP